MVGKVLIPSNARCFPSHSPLGLFPASALVPSALTATVVSITDVLSFISETYNVIIKYYYLKQKEQVCVCVHIYMYIHIYTYTYVHLPCISN